MTFSRRCDDDDKEINNFFVNQIIATTISITDVN